MKNLFLPLILICSILTSCETKEELKEESKKTVTVSTDIYLDVNDAIIERVEKAQIILAQLDELDAKNVLENEMSLAAESAKKEVAVLTEELKEIVPVGKGGTEYLYAAVDFLSSASEVIQVYSDFAPSLSIIEDDWSELQVQEWFNLAEPVFLDYKQSFDELIIQQSNYAALQNIEIESLESEITSEEEEITESI